jgi:hypothetical protein
MVRSIHNYNSLGVETTGFLAHSSNIPKCRPCNDLTDPTGHSPSIEQDEEDCAPHQLIIGSHYEPEQIVFVDESAFDRCVSRCPFA